MPLYMDVHRNLGPVKADDIARAHLKDLDVEKKYGVHYHKYWFNEETGAVFCLVEGPDAETCERVHAEAHGLVADDLIEVEPRLVEAFLSSGINLDGAAVSVEGIIDSAFRVVLFTEVDNYGEVAGETDAGALTLMERHDRIVRAALGPYRGREIRHNGEGIMASFTSVTSALRFAQELQQKCADECESVLGQKPCLRIGIAAGEPVESNRNLFGVTVTAARRICEMAGAGEILVSGAVRELAVGKGFKFAARDTTRLKGIADPVTLFRLQTEVQHAEAAQRQLADAALAHRPRRGDVLRQFWGELRRRHVVTVAAVYAAALFGLLQIAQLTFEPLGLPGWSYTLFLVIGIFGFPLALVLAWAFDLNVSAGKEYPRDEHKV
ncbi:MAG TPA: nickel-binding protein [Longimicrobiales bacterium]|nr:nickel-binding protein [Longimicrobiales bacterium]